MHYYSSSSLFVCTVLAWAARMSKLKCQIHQLIMDFVPGKVTTGGRFRTSTNLPPFSCCSHKLHTSGVCAATPDCGSILAIVRKFANSQPGNLLPPSSSRAISFTISISALATKTGNKSKVIKAVAQRQEGREGGRGDKTIKFRNKDRQSLHVDLCVGDNHRKNKEN